MAQWNILGPFDHDDAMGKLETPAMGKWAPDDLMGEIGGPIDYELFSNGLIRLHCAFSNLYGLQILIEKF